MNTIDSIMTRVSVRKFKDDEIPEEALKTILAAGMAGPSATNARPFSFIVLRDKEMLEKVAAVNGPAANPLLKAKMGIMVCADMERAFKPFPMFAAVDTTIAAENIILAAWELGIGTCWLGTWPREDCCAKHQELLGLPETIVPHHIIAMGYPDQETPVTKVKWEEDRIHMDKW